jgi:hypothetical protein
VSVAGFDCNELIDRSFELPVVPPAGPRRGDKPAGRRHRQARATACQHGGGAASGHCGFVR